MPNDYLANVSFLIVDDHAITRTLIVEVLRTFGATRMETANDGTRALQIMKTFQPDIAIVDWQMSPMDGIAFTNHIRKSKDSPNVFLPIIMMTGVSERSQVIAAREAGVNEYVIKPLTAKTLISRVRAVIDRQRRFVRLGEYFGPDRRRKKKAFEGDSRRGLAEQPVGKVPHLQLQEEAQQNQTAAAFKPKNAPPKKD